MSFIANRGVTGARVVALIVLALLSGCQGMRDLDQWWQQQGRSQDAAQDAAEAEYREGLRLSLAGPASQTEAVEQYRRAAEAGHPGARYLLGMSYLAGQGVERDPRRALEWLEPLAETGHAQAQYHVGEIYLNGAGVPEERAWAVHWYERSARLGYAKAQFAAGVAYASGMGGITDLKQGWFWLTLAAGAGQPNSSALLQRLRPQLDDEIRRTIRAQTQTWRPESQEQPSPQGLVRFVQYVLALENYQPGPIDGLWGPRTADALTRYQRQHRLTPGTLNQATLASLRQQLRARPI